MIDFKLSPSASSSWCLDRGVVGRTSRSSVGGVVTVVVDVTVVASATISSLVNFPAPSASRRPDQRHRDSNFGRELDGRGIVVMVGFFWPNVVQ